jgi:hypothetical protein
MRFSQAKIQALAEKIVAMLEEDREARLLESEDQLRLAAASAIVADLQEEDEIDEEVDRVMEQYQRQIDNEAMDVSLLRRKIKQQIAKKRGFEV